jgi:hypothetical protein
MVKSRWVDRKLRNFRTAIEAGISCLKRAYGLARCTWRGLDHFRAYVWSWSPTTSPCSPASNPPEFPAPEPAQRPLIERGNTQQDALLMENRPNI